MKNNRTIYAIAGLSALLVIVLWLGITWIVGPVEKNKPETPPETPPAVTPVVIPPKLPPPTEDDMVIRTTKGDVKLNKVYEEKIPGTEYDLSFTFRRNDDYSMNYFPKDKMFLIVIYNVDIGAGRAKAEADFLEILNVTKEQACLLNTDLKVPASVNSQAAGFDFGLSFCPEGRAFPK